MVDTKLNILEDDRFRSVYARLAEIAADPKLDEFEVGQSLIDLELKIRGSGNIPKVLREAEDGVSPVISLVDIFKRMKSDSFTGRVSKEEKLVNPDWKDPSLENIDSEWFMLGGFRERWGGGGHLIRTGYSLTRNAGDVILQTEPYEIAEFFWPEAQTRLSQRNFQIRNKHTGEFLASLQRAPGFRCDTSFKYLNENKDKRGGRCYQIAGGFLHFFSEMGDTGYTTLDGNVPPIIRGTLFRLDSSPEADRVYELCRENEIARINLTRPETRYEDFQPVTHRIGYELKKHPGYGVEVIGDKSHGSPGNKEVLQELASDCGRLKIVRGSSGPGQDFGGKQFSWDLFS